MAQQSTAWHREWKRQWRIRKAKADPSYSRRAKLKQEYGISLSEYQKMHDEQDGLCAICQNYDEKLHVDHDHETGKIRGLLCTQCNTGIGLLGDNVETLHSAIDYLECHSIDERMRN